MEEILMLRKDTTGKYKHKNHWVLLSRKTPHRVLRVYGTKKPSDTQVRKDEARIEMFKHMKGRR